MTFDNLLVPQNWIDAILEIVFIWCDGERAVMYYENFFGPGSTDEAAIMLMFITVNAFCWVFTIAVVKLIKQDFYIRRSKRKKGKELN